MDSIYSAANSASRAVFGESTADPNRAGRPTNPAAAAETTDTAAHTANPYRGTTTTTDAHNPFRNATDIGGSGTRHTGGSTHTARPMTTTTSTLEKPSVGDLNKDGMRHDTDDTDRPFGAAIRSEERPTISDTGILPPAYNQSAQKPLETARREHGGVAGASDTRQPHTASTGIVPAPLSTATGEHHASDTRNQTHEQLGSNMPGAYDQHTTQDRQQPGSGLTGSGLPGAHDHHTTQKSSSGIPGAYDQHTTQQSGSGLAGSGLPGAHDQHTTQDRQQSGSGIPGAYDHHSTQDRQQSGSGLTGSGMPGTRDHHATQQSGSGLAGAYDQHTTQDRQQSGSGLTGSSLPGSRGQHSQTDDRTHDHDHQHSHSGTRDHQQSVSSLPGIHEQQQSSSDPPHTPSTSTTSTQPKPPITAGPAIMTLPTAPKSTESGTGEKYEKSTGVAAEGGDFDASRPGAGREADRLLDQQGIHHGAEKKDAAAPAAGALPHKKKDVAAPAAGALPHEKKEHHEPAAHTAEEHKGLGEKIKEKLHLGHH